jgi:hypothetical protein
LAAEQYTRNNIGLSIENRKFQRLDSYSLVEVRSFKHFPIFCKSAGLLDLSLGGFKVEFTDESKYSPGSKFWFYIPMAPLGMIKPKYICVKAECRWFDAKRYRIGAVFTSLNEKEKSIIERIMKVLTDRKNKV